MSNFLNTVRPLHGVDVDPAMIYHSWYSDVVNVLTHGLPSQAGGLIPYQLHIPSADLGGLAVKPLPLEPADSAATDTANEIAIAKIALDKFTAFQLAHHQVRCLVLESMGPDMCQAASDPIQ